MKSVERYLLDAFGVYISVTNMRGMTYLVDVYLKKYFFLQSPLDPHLFPLCSVGVVYKSLGWYAPCFD